LVSPVDNFDTAVGVNEARRTIVQASASEWSVRARAKRFTERDEGALGPTTEGRDGPKEECFFPKFLPRVAGGDPQSKKWDEKAEFKYLPP